MKKQSDIIYYEQPNIYGTKFRCSRRTAAHLDATKYALKKKSERDKKKYSLRIIQGSFNTTVEASAGTHDKDAVLDVEIDGMSWGDAQKFLRINGWAAWVRTPDQGFSYHIHMISLPKYRLRWVAPVGEYVPGQVEDFYNHEDGLAGGGHDYSWFPPNIPKTIFKYRRWVVLSGLRKQKDRLFKKLSDIKKRIKKFLKK